MTTKSKLLGLVLVGGKSKRMNKDKSALEYHGMPQSRYIFKLLQNFCDEVYVSCRKEQAEEPHLKDLPQIHDQYDLGPAGGIISAQEKISDAAFFVVACDLPFVSEDSLEQILKNRDPSKIAVTFYNEEKKWPEPLCSIYEPASLLIFKKFISEGVKCPRRILSQSDAKTILPADKNYIKNVNTPQDFEKIKAKIL